MAFSEDTRIFPSNFVKLCRIFNKIFFSWKLEKILISHNQVKTRDAPEVWIFLASE